MCCWDNRSLPPHCDHFFARLERIWGFLSDCVPTVATHVIAMTASESARFAQFAEQTNVGPHTLEQFEADLRRIVTTYPNRPVYPMFVELRELRNRAFELLEGRQRLDQTRDLYLVAGLLCGVLANASYDLGYLDAAETQCRTAYLCAELAGHNGLKAWIRGTQSMIAYWDDRPHTALNLAVEGSRYEPETGTAGVWLAAIEARSRARLRDAAGAQSALRRAEEARAAVVGPDDPGGMMAFPEAKQMYYAATTHLWIGDPAANREAERSAEAAVRAYLEDPPERRRIGEMSLARLDLAAARLAQGDLDGTAEQVQDVLDVGARRRTESVARRLGEVAIVLERPVYQNTGLALNLHDQITDYLRTATVPALPPGTGSKSGYWRAASSARWGAAIAAEDVARQVAEPGFRDWYVEANAISMRRCDRIASGLGQRLSFPVVGFNQPSVSAPSGMEVRRGPLDPGPDPQLRGVLARSMPGRMRGEGDHRREFDATGQDLVERLNKLAEVSWLT